MTISIVETFIALGTVQEQLEATMAMLDEMLVGPLRTHQLREVVRQASRAAREHYLAAEILMSETLADHFPDGEAAPASLSPRQVLYLAALAQPARQSREAVGLPPTRQCQSNCKDDSRCSASSLLFSTRAVCGSHATDAERERNRKAKAAWNNEHPDYLLAGVTKGSVA